MSCLIQNLRELVTNDLPDAPYGTEGGTPSVLIGGIVGGRTPSRYAESPKLWQTYARLTGAPLYFAALDVPRAEHLPSLLDLFAGEPLFVDLTITDPYKHSMYGVLNRSSLTWTAESSVRDLASVNHLVKAPDSLHDTGQPPAVRALNTDGRGMADALRERTTLPGAHVLLIGAGGAARSIAYELLHAGASVHIANMYDEETQRLVRLFQKTVPNAAIKWSDFSEVESAGAEADIIVNTVPAGCPITELARISDSHRPVIAEAPYGNKAALFEFANTRGLVYVGGRAMLFGQFLSAVELLRPRLCEASKHSQAVAIMRKSCIGG